MRQGWWATGAALALAACGGGETPPDPAEVAANQAQAAQLGARVASLSEGQRNGVFIRAIRDAGARCQGVTKSERVPEPANTWVADCADGSRHTITFGADEMAQVTSVRAP